MFDFSKLTSTDGKTTSPRTPSPRASTFGMLFDSGSKRAFKRVSTACQLICATQILCGIILAGATLLLLNSELQTLELMVAGCLAFIGTTGIWGSRSRSVGLLNLHVAVTFLSILFIFQSLNEVARDVRTDCAMAELHLRTKQVHDFTFSTSHTTMIHAVHERLSEVEHLLADLDGRVMDLNEGLHSKVKDVHLIRDKMQHLRETAQALLSPASQGTGMIPDDIASLPQEVQADLKKRMRLAKQVLLRLDAHDLSNQDDHHFAYEEYVHFLQSLKAATSQPLQGSPAASPLSSSLGQAVQDLPKVKSALDRVNSHKQAARQKAEDLDQVHMAHRSKWAQKFYYILQSHGNHPTRDVLEDMPEHCLKGRAAGMILGQGIWLVVLLQGASVYMALTLTTILAKRD